MYSTKGATNDNKRREMKIVIYLSISILFHINHLYKNRLLLIKFNKKKRRKSFLKLNMKNQ